MSVNQSLRHLGIPRGTFYRWKKEQAWLRERIEPITPVQAFEALAEEKQAVIAYALSHPDVTRRFKTSHLWALQNRPFLN